MKSFSLVHTSLGRRCEFKMIWGLRAGYGQWAGSMQVVSHRVV
jgi:hypothetical protein